MSRETPLWGAPRINGEFLKLGIEISQATVYPAVVIPLMMQHHMMLRRNLLYTGITRGRRLVVLVGQKQAVGR